MEQRERKEAKDKERNRLRWKQSHNFLFSRSREQASKAGERGIGKERQNREERRRDARRQMEGEMRRRKWRGKATAKGLVSERKGSARNLRKHEVCLHVRSHRKQASRQTNRLGRWRTKNWRDRVEGGTEADVYVLRFSGGCVTRCEYTRTTRTERERERDEEK